MNEMQHALADLGEDQRHRLKIAACTTRDQSVERGEHAMARVWNALAMSIAEIEDEERAIIRRLEDDLAPRRLTDTELNDGES